jgi:hypothetical protein
MAQLDLLNLNPNEVERPFEHGDSVIANQVCDGLVMGSLVTGYIRAIGIKYLVLSREPCPAIDPDSDYMPEDWEEYSKIYVFKSSAKHYQPETTTQLSLGEPNQ